MSVSIDALRLSQRALNAFKSNGIFTLRQLEVLSLHQMRSLAGVGRKVATEAQAELARYSREVELRTAPNDAMDAEQRGAEIDAFVDAMVQARDHGFETTTMLLSRSRAELLVHLIPSDVLDLIEAGLNRWGIQWRAGGRPMVGATETKSRRAALGRGEDPQPRSGDRALDDMRQAVRFVLEENEELRRTAPCVLAYLGLDDRETPTLQRLADSAEEYGFGRPVTRERVRQVVQKADHYIRSQADRIQLGTWHDTVEEMRKRTPMAATEFAAGFGYQPGNAERQVAELEKWADRLDLDWPFAILETAGMGSVIVTKGVDEKWRDRFRKIPREAGGSYVFVDTAAAVLGCEAEFLRRMLDASSKWDRLDEGGSYYAKRLRLPVRDLGKTGNALLTTLLRVFSVVERTWSAELVLSIARARILRRTGEGMSELPVEVVEAMAARSGLLVVRGGEVMRAPGKSWNTLNEHDEAVLRVYAEHGRTVSSDVLHADLIRAGLTQDSARLVVACSPFCVHLRSGVGHKEGRYKSIARISDIQRFLAAADHPEEAGKERGEPQVFRVPIDARARMTGEGLLSEARGMDGQWAIRDTSERCIAEVKVAGRRIHGLQPVLRAFGLGRGDTLVLRRSAESLRASGEKSAE